jgi:hypothetical protein
MIQICLNNNKHSYHIQKQLFFSEYSNRLAYRRITVSNIVGGDTKVANLERDSKYNG